MFDNLEPGFTFLPADLGYFIRFEEEDFQRRQAIVDERHKERQQWHDVPPSTSLPPPPRRCPTAQEYLRAWIVNEPKWPSSALGGAYTRFTMPDYKQRPDVMLLQAWHGAPMAAVLHAFRAILGNLTPPEFVAPSIKKQLQTLQELYERRLETCPGAETSVNLGELSLPNTRASASTQLPNLGLGPDMPSLPPPQSLFSMPDPSAKQAEMQAQDAKRRRTESAEALVATKALSEQPCKKRRRMSSSASLPQHELRRKSPSPPTPALTCKASTISRHASPGLQPHRPVNHNNGRKARKETREDPFSYVFRYDWRWGPQSSTQEKVERFLGLSKNEDVSSLEQHRKL